jgi:hypothetical protein
MNSNNACPTCHRPYTPQKKRHAVRNTDPSTSRQAVTNRKMRWNSMGMMALRIFYEHAATHLSHHQVQQLAETRWGAGCLGKSPWKRSGELATDFDPPLIEPVCEVEGEFGDPVEAYQITATGLLWYLRGLKEKT